MSRQLALLASAVLIGVSSAYAQTVTFTGQIEDVSGTQNQFFLDCTGTTLTSTAFNLNQFMDQDLEITGTWNGSAVSPAVEVTALAPAVENFEIGGGAKIGEVSNLSFFAAPGTAVAGRLGTQTSFVPIPGAGVLFLDLSNAVLGLSGVVGGGGIAQLNFAIPNNPALIGLEIYGQGALIEASGITLTNPDCKTIDN